MRLLSLLHLGAEIGFQIVNLVDIDSSSHLKFELSLLALVQFDLGNRLSEELLVEVLLRLFVDNCSLRNRCL